MIGYRIVGAIAIIWGVFLFYSRLLGGIRVEGTDGGLIFGRVLLIAGLYAVITGVRKKP